MNTLHRLAGALEAGTITARALVEGCLERIQDPAGEGGRAFIRVKEEVDKEGLLAADLPAESLRPLGLQVIQEESFYITPRLTDTPLRQAA